MSHSVESFRTTTTTTNRWQLLDNFLTTSWQLIDNFLTTYWQLIDKSLTTFWQLLDNFLRTSWQILDNFLTTTWQLIDNFIWTRASLLFWRPYKLQVIFLTWFLNMLTYVDKCHKMLKENVNKILTNVIFTYT